MGAHIPFETVMEPPRVHWWTDNGPVLKWAGHIHQLRFIEILAVISGVRSADQIAVKRWPELAGWRTFIVETSSQAALKEGE